MKMAGRHKVCANPHCAELAPCPKHSRPKNAPWSKDRDRQQQHRFRLSVLNRDNWTCTRCGHHDTTGKSLVAHHVRDGYEQNAGVTRCNRLANDCHGKVDANAR